jgi:hypothetical protein
MFDFIHALRGKKHCLWCGIHPDNFIERWAGGYVNEKTKLQKIIWWLYEVPSHKVGIWRLGQYWHFKFHVTDLERADYGGK